jgi:hypothetical protein
MSFIPIMEVSKNGTEALEKEEEVRITVEQKVIQSEGEKEIEGTRSTIAKQSIRQPQEADTRDSQATCHLGPQGV